jgi:hypothetical protein
MKKQGNTTLLKVHNFSIIKSKDTEIVEVLDKNVKCLVFRMINDLRGFEQIDQ